MTSAKLVHTRASILKESQINVNNLCHSQNNKPSIHKTEVDWKTTNKTLSHKQTKVYWIL